MSLITSLANRVQGHAVVGGASVNPLTGRVQPVSSGVVRPEWLHAKIETQDRTAQHDRRGKEGFLHVSGLIDFCPRQHAILRRDVEHRPPLVTSVDSGMRLIWAIGRAVEAHIRAQLIEDDRASVYGVWTCACEDTTHTGHFPDNRVCHSCRKRLTTYREVTLLDHEARVTGNPDLILHVHDAFLPVEIKSMNRKEWDLISTPRGDHLFQNGWYARMMLRNGWRVHRKAFVVYACKDYLGQGKSPYKVFEIDTQAPALAALIDESRRVAMAAHAGAVPDAELPPRPCANPQARMAKKCACVAPCFIRYE